MDNACVSRLQLVMRHIMHHKRPSHSIYSTKLALSLHHLHAIWGQIKWFWKFVETVSVPRMILWQIVGLPQLPLFGIRERGKPLQTSSPTSYSRIHLSTVTASIVNPGKWRRWKAIDTFHRLLMLGGTDRSWIIWESSTMMTLFLTSFLSPNN